MKKLIRLTFGILFSSLMASTIFAADIPVFTATSSPDTVEIGDTFTLSVSLENNPGVNTVAVDVHYDTDLLTCTKVSADTVLSADGIMFAGNPDNGGKVSTAAISIIPIVDDGELLNLTFSAKAAGSSELSLVIRDMVSNGNKVASSARTEGTFITVISDTPATPIQPEQPEKPTVPVAPDVSFSDVPTTHWAYTYIQDAVNNGLFSGIGNGQFGPGMNVTRGMFVTTLYSSAGSPDVELSDFSDVADNAWYAKAVAWASQEGIVSGIGNNKFGPDLPITREQIALILFNYADAVSPGTEMFVHMFYPDSKDIHDWALGAFTWALKEKIISGKSGDILDPLATATRAEVAVIMQNFINLSK